MRVLFPARLDVGPNHGGDLRIVQECARELYKLGCDVTISSRLHEDYTAFDIVHFVNINNAFETYLRLRRIRSNRRQPGVVLTPFHHKTAWVMRYYRQCLGLDLGPVADQASLRFDGVMSAKDAVRYSLAALTRPALVPRLPLLAVSAFRQKHYIVNHIDALLVHTAEEGQSVRQDFRAGSKPCWEVPVGRHSPSPELRRPELPAGYILSVGRIEPLKNQLALIEAARALQVPLVLVGQENLRHRDYIRRFRAALVGRRDVIHLPFTKQPGLDALYHHAKVHVIASWCEVFPLVTIEAATNGCRVVTTRNSYEASVYGAGVQYVDPQDVGSIRASIEHTSTDATVGRSEAVTTRVQSWRRVAERLLEVYRAVAR